MPGQRFPAAAGGVLAVLVAAASLGGLFLPSTYAQETAGWAAQGTGQDWVNLVLVAPWLAVTGWLARRGAARARLLLGGALVYTAYSFAIYAFALHFNRLFLFYCATLGLSCFALVALGASFGRGDLLGWYIERRTARAAGAWLGAMAVLFAGLWLTELLPSILHGLIPASVAESGLLVNPVHVLDLSLALPAMLLAGLSLWRRRPLGLWLGPVLLAFSVLMMVALVGMMMTLRRRGLPAPWPITGLVGGLGLANTAMLMALLRGLRFSGVAAHQSDHAGVRGAGSSDGLFRAVEPLVNNDKRDQYVARDELLKMLSDDEVASVCTAETKARLPAGDEFIDLAQLHKGVQKARTTATSLSSVLPRSAVQDRTWHKLVTHLATLPASHLPPVP